MGSDLAVVSQDPRFGGGVRAQLDAFWDNAVALGHRPRLLYVTHPSLRHEDPGPYDHGVSGLLGRLDAVNQLIGGLRLAPRVAEAELRWVVSTTASHGWAALKSHRPYAAWIGTSLDDEWRGRQPWLPPARKAALAVNAPALRRMERAVLGGAATVCATSPASRAGLAKAAGLDEDAIEILPIPVDVDAFVPLGDADWEAGLERPTLAFVGRPDDPRKNLSLLVDALPLLRRHVPRVRVVVIGGRPSASLPDGVEVLGRVTSVADAIRGATLLVVASRQEGFGVAAAEALASGLPVISTPCGGPEELIERSGGGRHPGWVRRIRARRRRPSCSPTHRSSSRCGVPAVHMSSASTHPPAFGHALPD